MKQHIARDFGHPFDQRPGFDLMEIVCDSKEELDLFIEKAESRFWHVWISGLCENGFSAVFYKPSGILCEWEDTPKKPFNTSMRHE